MRKLVISTITTTLAIVLVTLTTPPLFVTQYHFTEKNNSQKLSNVMIRVNPGWKPTTMRMILLSAQQFMTRETMIK